MLGAKLEPVSIDSAAQGFIRLFEDPRDARDPAFADDWINYFRRDDYSVTAYYCLDRP